MIQLTSRNILPATITHLASIQQAAGLLDDSAATFRKLLEINPAYATAAAQYAQTLLLMGKNSEALAAVEKEPDPASKLTTLARVIGSPVKCRARQRSI